MSIILKIYCIILFSEFANIILKLVGKDKNSKSKIIKVAAMKDDPHQRKPDITRAKTHLHWKPVVSNILC